MRTLVVSIIAAVFLAAPAQAYEADSAKIPTNHVEVLDYTLDSTEAADEYLGPFGACMRGEAVDAAKDAYGSHDRSKTRDGCYDSGDCVNTTPGEPYVSLENCEEIIMDIIKDAVGIGPFKYVGITPDTSTLT